MRRAFVINGAGGVGKDTLIEQFKEKVPSYIPVYNVSSVDVIKEIATKYGKWEGQKDLKSRKFLSDLKKVFTDYNDLPTTYLIDRYRHFMEGGMNQGVLFVHIREPEEIKKFVKGTNGKAVTILIQRKGISEKHYGNHSDDDVANYNYDVIFDNDKSIEESSIEFTNIICSFLK